MQTALMSKHWSLAGARDLDHGLGSDMNLSASLLASAAGMVAENSRVWRWGLGSLVQIFLDIRDEAHVEHAVGFINDQHGHIG